MKLFTIAALLGCIISVPAMAADDYASTAPTSATTHVWNGFYVGVHAGYGWGDADATTRYSQPAPPVAFGPTKFNFDVKGWLGGAQVGYNFQINNIVLGLEGNASKTDVSGDFSYDPTRTDGVAGGKIDWLASVRGKVGVAMDNTLLYGTAGIAFSHTKGHVEHFYSRTPLADHGTFTTNNTGYVVGVGIEQALTQSISFKAEYLYYDLGTDTGTVSSAAYPAGSKFMVKSHPTFSTIQVGINYHF